MRQAHRFWRCVPTLIVRLLSESIPSKRRPSLSRSVHWVPFLSSAFDIILRRTQTEAIDPPERLFSSRPYNPPALDLWSFGATFAEFFTPVRLISDDLSSGSSSKTVLPTPTTTRTRGEARERCLRTLGGPLKPPPQHQGAVTYPSR